MDLQQARDMITTAGYFADLSKDSREQFLNVCASGPTDVMLAYLAIGMDVNARVESSLETALIKAAEGGSIERLGLLLDAGASIELKDNSGDTALRTALNWSHPEAARYLHSRGADLTAMNPWGEDALNHAVAKGAEADIALLLELGADPNVVSFNDRSTINTIIQQGREDLLTQALQHGADPKRSLGRHGMTALHRAVGMSNSSLAALLMQHGADPFAKDAFGATARDFALEMQSGADMQQAIGLDKSPPTAAEQARAEVWHAARAQDFDKALTLAQQAGLSLDMRDHAQKSLLCLACSAQQTTAVEKLLNAGATANVRTEWEPSPLFAAVEKNDPALVKLLIAHGARGSTTTGETLGLHTSLWEQYEEVTDLVLAACDHVSDKHWAELLGTAVMKSNPRLIKSLHKHGAPLNAHREIGGETTLHQICTNYPELESLEYLLANGASLTERDSQGLTPLHALVGFYKYDQNYMPLLRALLAAGAPLDSVDVYQRTPFASSKDQSRDDLITLLVLEPAEKGDAFSALTAKQNWATLEIWYAAGRVDEVRRFIEGGVAFEPPSDIHCSPLLQAVVSKQDVEMLAFLLARGANVNRLLTYGSKLIETAAGTGNVALATMLLDHGARLDEPNDWHATPLHAATKSPEMLRLFLARGADAAAQNVTSPLFAAIQNGDLECVQLLIAAGAAVNVFGRYHGSLMHLAISQSRADMVSALLAAGADADVVAPNSGEPALVTAAKKGEVSIVRLLLDAGANPSAASRDGDTGLSLFAQRKELRTAFADILLAHGMDVTPPTPKRLPDVVLNPSEYWTAVYSGDLATLRTLLTNGHDANERDLWGETALMHAVGAANYTMVELLIEHKADVEAVNSDKWPVMAYIGFQGNPELEQLLETAAGKKLLSMDILNGKAARSLFADDVRKKLERGELKKITEMLLEQKINPHDVQNGMSMMHLALQIRDEDLIEYLLALGLSPVRRDLQGVQPFVFAVQQQMYALAENWLAQDPSLVDQAVHGQPLVLHLLSTGSEESVEWLINHGAKLDGRNAMGRTFLHLCVDGYKGPLAARMIDKCASLINVADEDGMTVLHAVLQNWWGNEELALALIKHNANVNAFNRLGMTPLHEAVLAYADQGAALLLAHGASWDFVAPGIEGAVCARALAEERSIDPSEFVANAAPLEQPPEE
jgi:serine/threonine-protein phosphatase 6 regulatory ankyrin repeat subunit A/serine/threonine-protein phosphatase 6 regulatory ankyrin repeat subunit B